MPQDEPLTPNALPDWYFDLPEDLQDRHLMALVHEDRSRDKILDYIRRFVEDHPDPEEVERLRRKVLGWGRPPSEDTARLREEAIRKHLETGCGAKKLAALFGRSRRWAQQILKSYRDGRTEGRN
jgi:hypothetical protein